MVVPLITSLFYFVFFAGTTFANGLYTLQKILLVVWPVVATRWILKEPLWSGRFTGHQPAGRSLLEGAILGIAIVTVMFGLMATPMGGVIREGADNIRTRVEGMGVLDHFLIFALFLSIIHSWIEEFYWRWFVYGNLRRLTRPWIAHVAAAIGFSAHHIVVLSQFFRLDMAVFLGVNVGIGGWLWSVLYARQGTLLGAWISHLIVDLGIMWLGAKLMGLF